jgi:hypothetical protein
MASYISCYVTKFFLGEFIGHIMNLTVMFYNFNTGVDCIIYTYISKHGNHGALKGFGGKGGKSDICWKKKEVH